jgi:hypothetical protein
MIGNSQVQANEAGQLNWFRQLVLEVKVASFAQHQKVQTLSLICKI